jgi:hypothetical protein
MEISWLVVLVMSVAALLISASRGETRNILMFSIIAVISLSMYLVRRRQRKNS